MKDKRNHELIKHDGIVRKVNPNSVIVDLSSDSNCSGCHAEALCNISGKPDKSIEIPGNYDVSPGETVTVLMKQSMGYKAVILGYLIPLALVITGLAVMVSIGLKESIAGIVSIAILVPYFIMLRLFRERLSSSFTFSIGE